MESLEVEEDRGPGSWTRRSILDDLIDADGTLGAEVATERTQKQAISVDIF